MSHIEIPQSREVRLEDGVLEGELENLAFDIRTGDDRSFAKSIDALKAIDELRRSRCVDSFRDMIMHEMTQVTLVPADIIRLAEEWHEDDVLGLHDPI